MRAKGSSFAEAQKGIKAAHQRKSITVKKKECLL
jgi:hypothetical protein